MIDNSDASQIYSLSSRVFANELFVAQQSNPGYAFASTFSCGNDGARIVPFR